MSFTFLITELEKYFSRFHIKFPYESFNSNTPGAIKKCGWFIAWFFGSDDNGNYAIIYSDHRHPGPSIQKWYEDGRELQLQELIESCNFNEEQLKQHEEDWYAKLYDILRTYEKRCNVNIWDLYDTNL